MPFRRELNAARLYVVLDREVRDDDRLFEVMQQTIGAGADVVQFRDKKGPTRDIEAFCARAVRWIGGRVPFIVNDRLDIAMATGAHGVHLGQEDLTLGRARRIVGKKMLIGVSCQTLDQALEAESGGADYIGFGSVFRTFTKPERSPMDLNRLQEVQDRVRIPVFAIGGIGPDNLERLMKIGVQRIAVTRAVCLTDDVAGVTRGLRDGLGSRAGEEHSRS